MTNFQNDIMDLLEGDTPKKKYEFLKLLLLNRETIIMKTLYDKFNELKQIQKETKYSSGSLYYCKKHSKWTFKITMKYKSGMFRDEDVEKLIDKVIEHLLSNRKANPIDSVIKYDFN